MGTGDSKTVRDDKSASRDLLNTRGGNTYFIAEVGMNTERFYNSSSSFKIYHRIRNSIYCEVDDGNKLGEGNDFCIKVTQESWQLAWRQWWHFCVQLPPLLFSSVVCYNELSGLSDWSGSAVEGELVGGGLLSHSLTALGKEKKSLFVLCCWPPSHSMKTSGDSLSSPSLCPSACPFLPSSLAGSSTYLLIMLQGCFPPSQGYCTGGELDDNIVKSNCTQMAYITGCFQVSTSVELFFSFSGCMFLTRYFLRDFGDCLNSHSVCWNAL